MPAIKFFAGLNLEQKSSFPDRHKLHKMLYCTQSKQAGQVTGKQNSLTLKSGKTGFHAGSDLRPKTELRHDKKLPAGSKLVAEGRGRFPSALF